MKLVKTVEEVSHYALEKQEAELLLQLLENFPFSNLNPATISSDRNPQTTEREMLLNDSLAKHREDLKRSAAGIFSMLSKTDSGYTLVLKPDAKEILIQILNDIRVGAWRALGEPENLDHLPEKGPITEQMHWHLMHLAGYFETALVESEF